MHLHEVAARCDRVQWTGQDGFTARCVAHDDRTPSMAVTERDGKLLVHCFAGCSQAEVWGALGLKGGKPLPNPKPKPVRNSKPTADYASDIWKAASPEGVETHPYTIKKRIRHAFGARRSTANGRLIGKSADCIVVPNRDWEGQLVGVECIDSQGVKQTFGSKGILVLGYPEDSPLVHICEGWATAWALSQLFPERFGCVVAFGKSRLDRYAKEAQERFSGNIAVHYDDDNNRDVWDVWAEGGGGPYARRIGKAANV